MKPLSHTFRGRRAERVRDVAQAQGVTYASLINACVDQALGAQGPLSLDPWTGDKAEGIRESDGELDRDAAGCDEEGAKA